MAALYERLFDPASANARIADLWWAVALKGVSAFVLGTLAVLWPAITLLTLALSQAEAEKVLLAQKVGELAFGLLTDDSVVAPSQGASLPNLFR